MNLSQTERIETLILQHTVTKSAKKLNKLGHKLNKDDPDRKMQPCAMMKDMTNHNRNYANNILFLTKPLFA